MEWLSGLSALGLVAVCCGAKAVALLLALRGRPTGPTTGPAESPEVQVPTEETIEARRPSCPWC